MKPTEANKLFAWMLGAFPQWRPDKGTGAVWANELPDVPASQAMAAVRQLMAARPSPFPPGVFEIVAAFQPPRIDAKAEAKIAFALVWNGRPTDDPAATKAAELANGGNYGNALTADKDWHERRFVDIYCAVKDSQAYENHQGLLGHGGRGADQGARLIAGGRPSLETLATGDASESARK